MIHPRRSQLRILRNLRVKFLKGFTTKTIPKLTQPILKNKNKSLIYKLYLREKKKLCSFYCITKNQLINYIKKSFKLKGFPTILLFQLLEMRLDTILFRFNLAPTIISARQLISHGHILINNKKVTIPSFVCSPNDFIKLNIKTSLGFLENLKKNKIKNLFKSKKTNFSHLKFDEKTKTGIIMNYPKKIEEYTAINYSLIINNY